MPICFLSWRSILKASVLEMTRKMIWDLTASFLGKSCFSEGLLNCVFCHALDEALNESSVCGFLGSQPPTNVPCLVQNSHFSRENKVFWVTLCRPQADIIQLDINITTPRTYSTSGTSVKLFFYEHCFSFVSSKESIVTHLKYTSQKSSCKIALPCMLSVRMNELRVSSWSRANVNNFQLLATVTIYLRKNESEFICTPITLDVRGFF